MGVHMDRQHLTEDQAFTTLKIASQNFNIKLRDIAAMLSQTGELPDSHWAGAHQVQ